MDNTGSLDATSLRTNRFALDDVVKLKPRVDDNAIALTVNLANQHFNCVRSNTETIVNVKNLYNFDCNHVVRLLKTAGVKMECQEIVQPQSNPDYYHIHSLRKPSQEN